MSYQFESAQSVLPPSASSGWNDPPNLSNASSAHTNRLNMRKRLVDPSCQGSTNTYGGQNYAQQGQTQPGVYNQQQYQQQQGYGGYTGGAMIVEQPTSNYGQSVQPQYQQQPSYQQQQQTPIDSAPVYNHPPSIGVPTAAPIGYNQQQQQQQQQQLYQTHNQYTLQSQTDQLKIDSGLRQSQQVPSAFSPPIRTSNRGDTMTIQQDQPSNVNQIQSNNTNATIPQQHRPVYDAFTINGSDKPYDPFVIRPQTSVVSTSSAPSSMQPYQ